MNNNINTLPATPAFITETEQSASAGVNQKKFLVFSEVDKNKALEYKINFRKISVANCLLVSKINKHVSNEDLINESIDLYFLKSNTSIKSEDITLDKLATIAGAMRKDALLGNNTKQLLSYGLYGLVAGAIAGVFDHKNYILYPIISSAISFGYFKCIDLQKEVYLNAIIKELQFNYNFHFKKIVKKNSSLVAKPSFLTKTDFFTIYKSLCCNLTCSTSQEEILFKALYVGVMNTWINNCYNSDTISENQTALDYENPNNATIIIQIIKNALVCLKLNQDLQKYHLHKKTNGTNDSAIKLAYEYCKQDKQNITDNKDYNFLHFKDKNQAYLEKLESLKHGCYFIKNIIANGQYGGIVRINRNVNNQPKYTYYMPLLEQEITTDSAKSFISLIIEEAHDFNFYALDKNNDVLVGETLSEYMKEIEASRK